MKISTGQEYAAKIINTKKLSARGQEEPVALFVLTSPLPPPPTHSPVLSVVCVFTCGGELN